MVKKKTKDQKKWRERLMSLAGLLSVCAISFQLIGGDRGLLAYYAMQQEKQEALKTLELVTEERMKLERHVLRMRPESLDLDLLEEQAKTVLGFIRPDEQMILLAPQPDAAPSTSE